MLRGILATLVIGVGLVFGGVMLSNLVSGQVRQSAAYRQSRIIGSIFSSREDVGIGDMLTDSGARNTLRLFAAALARAYVDFEFIPYGEAGAFSVIQASIPAGVEITGFNYHGRDLTITGIATDEEGYNAFIAALRGKDYFLYVSGGFQPVEGGIHFEIECLAQPSEELWVLPLMY